MLRGLALLLTIQFHQLGETENRIQWRAQFVAHAGDKAGLGQVGCFCFVGSRAQVTFDVLEVVNINVGAGNHHHFAGIRITLQYPSAAQQPVIQPLLVGKAELGGVVATAAQG